MDNEFQARQQKNLNYFNNCLSTLSSTVFSNEESLKKTELKLDDVTQNISKLKTKLVTQKEIYFSQQKDINRCILTISSFDQNNRVIHSQFEEKLNIAIHDTEQVAMKLSNACNQAPALQFHASYSRFDDIEESLLKYDDEIQMFVNKAPIQLFGTTMIQPSYFQS
eukprot:9187939-Ditylum_brightwellii.AAC.1